jgi:nitronate monooxygenase
MFQLGALSKPIVQAPMAGGPSTVGLAVAVSDVGGLGFLAAGYKQAEAVQEEIEALRAAIPAPFGVNLFVPTPQPADSDCVREYLSELESEAVRQGAELGQPSYEDDDWERKLDLVCKQRVPVVSFTFGCPAAAVIDRLHRVDSAVWVTITTPQEAVEAQGAGADALVVQGTEAGGHRGGFTDSERDQSYGLLALLRLVSAVVRLPLIATGGIADGAAVAAVLCAGASAAQIGTALLLTPEAGTVDAHRALIGEPVETRLTRAFTGRLARGIVNRFMDEHSASAPIAYPEIHHATSPLRAAARKRGDAEAFNLWAGQAHPLAQSKPAAEIVTEMAAEAARIVDGVAAGWASGPTAPA